MPEHKLPIGRKFIEGIEILGKILRYFVRCEYPINTKQKNPSSIDIAWFKEENQKFPLFIFEVESTATNAIVYNPMKVFSKSNEIFEKPLFFFQIVLKRGNHSSRIDDLKRQYGNYNYRIYTVSSSEDKIFLFDILSQHRRLTQNLDIISLIEFLFNSDWLSIDLKSITKHIEELEFEKESGNILRSYALLATEHEEMIPIFYNFLKRIHREPLISQYKISYNTYFGLTWYFPIHLGIISTCTNDLYEKTVCFKQLKAWQENYSYKIMIGPHFGLSQDYDIFLTEWSGFFLALLSSLFLEFNDARLYLAKVLQKIIQKSSDKYKILNMLWLMHIAPNNKEGKKLYNYGMNFFKKLRRFSNEIFNDIPINTEYKDFVSNFMEHKDKIPSQNDCLILSKNNDYRVKRYENVKVALRVLTNNELDDKLSTLIISILHSH